MSDQIPIFGLACSLREESLNEKLLHSVARLFRERPAVEAQTAKLTEYPLPLYNADIQDAKGIPEAGHQLRDSIEAANNVLLVTPEYNHSIAGPLKNAIDWTSRFRPNPWTDTNILLMAAAPSRMGGLRGLQETRVPLQALGAHVYPKMYGLSNAHQAFDADNRLQNQQRRSEIASLVDAFIEHLGGGPTD